MILGNLGRNHIVAHRRSIYRCSPEQLRFATESEQTVSEFSDNELLGIKNLLEKGQFPRSQFTDLIPEGEPPSPEVVSDAVHSQSLSGALTAADKLQQQQTEESIMPDVDMPKALAPTELNWNSGRSEDARYGPLRIRHTYKRPERFEPLRVVEDHSEEFLEMKQNVGELTNASSPSSPSHENTEHASPRASGHKRSVSIREGSQEPPTHKAKHDDSAECGGTVLPRGPVCRSGRCALPSRFIYGSISAEESSKGAGSSRP